MDTVSAEQFLLDQFPQRHRSLIPTTLKTAYSAVGFLIKNEPILQVASAEDNHGRIISWSVDLAFMRLTETGQWPFEYRWCEFAKPTGRYLEIRLSHSVFTTSQVADPKKQPRNVVFRQNARFNNEPFFDLEEFEDERAVTGTAPAQLPCDKGRILRRIRMNNDIQAIVQQVGARGTREKFQLQGRVAPTEFSQVNLQHLAHKFDRREYAQASVDLAFVADHLVSQCFHIIEHLQAALVKSISCLGQLNAPRGAIQQAFAEFFFQLLEVSADPRLGHTEIVRRPGDGIRLHYGDKYLQVVKLHTHIVRYQSWQTEHAIKANSSLLSIIWHHR